jgi:D-alanine-D-alanine ligase-like ATP-grasp enzyme
MLAITEKACLECGDAFKGRSDKKFCSDQCRSTYNNHLHSDTADYIREVNSILRKNRRILVELNPDGKTWVSVERLKNKGFNFSYFTSTSRTKDGAQYFYCYEQGYLPLEKGYFLLVIKKEL